MPKTDRREHNPDWPWAKDFRISQAVQVGDTLYVSGQGPLDPQGNLVGPDDMAAQARQVFANLGAVLEEAGASMNDIVKITSLATTTWITRMGHPGVRVPGGGSSKFARCRQTDGLADLTKLGIRTSI